MYKRLKCVLAIVSLGIILVGCQMNNEEKSPKNETKTSKHVSHQKMTKKQQLAYLKEHEQEIIDYVKSQNNKIESVQIDWSDIRWSKGGNGTPQGGGEGILLHKEEEKEYYFLGRLIIILNQVGELILIQKKDG
ncbi:lipoprotein BUG3 [Streptococcus iniae]|nr:lipoprotein BUG3 [Streptococcus iniae]MCM0723425.1 lipoprotein BUG3 [Streptococcus iniae]